MIKVIPKDISGRGVLWSRYEMKYLITESTAAGIVQFIKPFTTPDRYCKNKPNGSYPIVSLYLDSSNLRLCRESIDGTKNRFKLRVRSYTDDQNYLKFFEIKRRVNTIIIKSRSQVMHDHVESHLVDLSRPTAANAISDDDALNQVKLYNRSINGKPTVRIRYMRQAFESNADKRVRITFDREICYNMTSSACVELNGSGWHPTITHGVVLEIKFTGHYPAWLNQIAKLFNLRKQSFSKYANSIKKGCLDKFNAPQITRSIGVGL